MKQKTVVAVVSVVFTAAVLIFVLWLFSGTKKETVASVANGAVTFSGQYGVSYPLQDLTEVQLCDNIPAIGRKVNGAGLGSIKKGDFEVEGMGVCRLFIQSENGPYLVLKFTAKTVIINFPDPQKTQALHDALT